MGVFREVFIDGKLAEIIYADPYYKSYFGFNFIIENSYLLNKKIFVGIKLYLNEYMFGDGSNRIPGAMLKLGYKL